MTGETGAILLAGRSILVVEDEYYIASDLSRAFVAAGAIVVGPTGALDRALALVESESIDAAVLDINLGGERIDAVADLLAEARIPFLFLTGFDGWALSERYRAVPRLVKPAGLDAVLHATAALLAAEIAA